MTRWLYATIEFIGDQAQVTILMSNGNHSVTSLGSHKEMYQVIAQMGADGWELSSTEQDINTPWMTENTRTGVRRLWFKKPLEG